MGWLGTDVERGLIRFYASGLDRRFVTGAASDLANILITSPGGLNGEAQISPLPSNGIVDGTGDHQPWSGSDSVVAAAVWDKLSNTAMGLFSARIDEPERRFSGEELAEILGILNGKHGVAGVLAWPGRHCFAVNRTWPWSWSYPEDGAPAVYWFTSTVAALFRAARDSRS